MAITNRKHIKSQYKYVCGTSKDTSGTIYWSVKMKDVGCNGFKTEREAALAVDKILIGKGKEAVNILKRK